MRQFSSSIDFFLGTAEWRCTTCFRRLGVLTVSSLKAKFLHPGVPHDTCNAVSQVSMNVPPDSLHSINVSGQSHVSAALPPGNQSPVLTDRWLSGPNYWAVRHNQRTDLLYPWMESVYLRTYPGTSLTDLLRLIFKNS